MSVEMQAARQIVRLVVFFLNIVVMVSIPLIRVGHNFYYV